jgi:4-methyl-5(b-hydroxyethyl)-thiazole monophosphate biosynthesis
MVAVLLAPGFEEIEAITVADYLNRAGINQILVGLDDKSPVAKTTLPSGKGPIITGSHKIAVQTDVSLEHISPSELEGIVIPGGMPGSANIAQSEKALAIIKELDGRGKLIAAICAAPAVVLMKTGILKGKKVTCYPGFEKELKDCHFVDERVVVDGNLITSRAPGTAAEFALKLIEILVGKNKADEISKGTLQK